MTVHRAIDDDPSNAHQHENATPVITDPEATVVQEGVAPAVVAPQVSEPVATAITEDPQPLHDLSAEVWDTVENWAAAWSAKNVDGYLVFYSPAFKTDGMSRAEWEQQRVSRINKIKVLEVKLSDLIVSVQDDHHATATFTQTYRSDRYRDVTRKNMQLEKSGDAWLIVSEQVTK